MKAHTKIEAQRVGAVEEGVQATSRPGMRRNGGVFENGQGGQGGIPGGGAEALTLVEHASGATGDQWVVAGEQVGEFVLRGPVGSTIHSTMSETEPARACRSRAMLTRAGWRLGKGVDGALVGGCKRWWTIRCTSPKAWWVPQRTRSKNIDTR